MLAALAREAGGGPQRTMILLLDGAGWHTQPDSRVPDGLRLFYLQPDTPDFQPAEHLSHLIDEPIVNQRFGWLVDIRDSIEPRCRDLETQSDTLPAHTAAFWIEMYIGANGII